ncbi:hypothetical protein Q4601_15175 [Shewanella sp. 1_MG-2023]|jgi:hypothetical protein|uniref:hypothetical protein n=1 Tax=unclassified Shewanella TaxID=196818 RepID=UPI001E483985|nr:MULTISPECIES: hypothetical protein [unclassified Shewanella]MCC4831687.1 hypothetical protein [Shewanella sp. 10N.7]MDO6611076.1 hypothetical protein [Shewanella sp. 7_MG-2023]MDO6771047.1 hypothetical protein [Shewanella sp. 2_MG-2023]MDO6795649.1 hypothetical protein [Shewanella sp. 1_MG-2023]
MNKSKYQFRVYRYFAHPNRISYAINEQLQASYLAATPNSQPVINHVLHFTLTLMTFGLWAIVWWWLILKARGEQDNLFAGFDDDYWSYLIERERPPAALYPIKVGKERVECIFEA